MCVCACVCVSPIHTVRANGNKHQGKTSKKIFALVSASVRHERAIQTEADKTTDRSSANVVTSKSYSLKAH